MDHGQKNQQRNLGSRQEVHQSKNPEVSEISKCLYQVKCVGIYFLRNQNKLIIYLLNNGLI